jgi:hypothetical protein
MASTPAKRRSLLAFLQFGESRERRGFGGGIILDMAGELNAWGARVGIEPERQMFRG